MITRTVICLLVACSLDVYARPDFIIDHEQTRQSVPYKPSMLFKDNLGVLTLDVEGAGTPDIVADLTNNLKERKSEGCSKNGAEICKRWVDENVQLTIGYETGGWRQITWVADKVGLAPADPQINCFPLGKFSWFGGPERKNQSWPIQKLRFEDHPMISLNENFQAVADPVWFNSRGIAIVVDRGVPLFINQNETTLCLIAKDVLPYRKRDKLILSYKIGYHKNAKNAFLRTVNDVLGKPTGVPDDRMVRYPTWSTWALFQNNSDEAKVRQLAKEIKHYGFKNSQLEIDDDWETCYGSLEFNKAKYPDISKLVRDLKREPDSFRVTLWTHPFVNTNCPLYHELKSKNYLVKNQTTTDTTWWRGNAGIIDFTNWNAAKDFEERQRQNLKDTGIDSLKFDAGETSWLPSNPLLPIPNSPYEDYPSRHTDQYLRTCAKFGSMVEVRTAYRTQDLPIFLRMIDKDTKWGMDGGLQSLVTTLLQFNMVGYPFVLPDMIGGNVYGNDVLTKELFIRWLQASTFMPALQYSRVPWEFDNQTVEIALRYAEIHANHTDKILKLMENSTLYGTPVNPPIWWNDPTDLTALEIDSEYMLGEDILVAPVLEEGVISRDIYLPEGKWKDMGSSIGKIHEGKQWLKSYPASLEILPYFVRVGNGASTLSAALSFIVASVFIATFGRSL